MHHAADPARNKLQISALSVIMIVIGALAVIFFILTVANDEAIQLALNWTPSEEDPQAPSFLLIYLERFGIIVSALFAFLGAAFMAIGLRLRGGNIRVAYWARIAILWLGMGLVAYIALTVFNFINNAAMDRETVDLGSMSAAIAPALIAALITFGLWHWLNRNIDRLFSGDDSLLGRETRLAWNMLIPTLTIFVLVAARPLEQTFIRSLTDKRFAGSEVPQFVGLENYLNLLTFRVDTVACKKSVTDRP